MQRNNTNPASTTSALGIARCLGLSLVSIIFSTQLHAADSAAIASAESDGTDLVVDVSWSSAGILPAWAELKGVSANGQGAVSITVIPAVGQTTTHLLPSLFADVATDGLQYSLQIADPSGAALGADYPLRVMLTCSPDDECTFSTVSGIETNAVFTRPELSAALDRQEAYGSSDVLHNALAAEPEIRGDVYGLALELPRQLKGSPGCSCYWQSSQDPPSTSEGMIPIHKHTSVLELVGWEGPGASFGLGALATGTDWYDMYSGKSAIALRQRCWQVVDDEVTRVILIADSSGGWQPVAVTVPVVSSCVHPCLNSTSMLFRAEACGTLSALFETGGLATASIDLEVSLPASGVPPHSLWQETDASGVELEQCSEHPWGLQTWDASLRLDSFGEIDLGPTAYGVSRLDSYALDISGTTLASCSEQATAFVHLSDGIPEPSGQYCPLGGNGDGQSDELLSCGLIIDPWSP